MPQFTHDGLNFHYEVVGEGFPFFLLHGLGNNNLQTLDMYEPIEGVMCVLPDQRGHGLSEGNEDMSLDTLSDDIIALADHLAVEQFAIGGISMGAAVSITTCLRHPERVRGLLLIRNAWADQPMSQNYIDLFTALADALKNNDPQMLEESAAYKAVYEQTPELALSMFDFFRDPVSLKYPEKFALVPPQQLIDGLEQLKEIRVPVEILANRQDNIHRYEYGEILHQGIEGSSFHEIACKKENKELYDSDINRYLRQLLAEISE
ncbi:MAG: alpha/beta hydrolase [Erysipelotrichaceae bacterium]|nr:alpha/beta hydrolase [Erysipelotrichaceae bacterium]MBR5048768.1 alpha/beta hydrolase [Erysipelotrichaceae bacterium]